MSARGLARSAALLALVAVACTRVGAPSNGPASPRIGPIGASIPDAAATERGVAAPARDSTPPPTRGGAAGPAATPGGSSRAALRFADVRGLWVVRFSLSSPASVHALVERASRAGFNTLVVQVRGRGDAWYADALEPRAAALAAAGADFDPLAQVIQEAHARGMAVHAWVNVALVADATSIPTDRAHLARAHPEALMVPRALARDLRGLRPGDPRYTDRLIEWTRAHTDRVEGLYASPASPAVRERTVAVAVDLAQRYDLDGVHFDYIRYPGPEFDYSAAALEAFRSWAAPLIDSQRRSRIDRASDANPLAWPDSLPTQWGDFRRQQVTTLLERAYVAVKSVRPWMVVSAAVYPDPIEARRGRMQDWAAWVRSGLLDAVAPMAYTADRRVFRAQMGRAIAAGPRTEIWAGIGAYMAGLQGTLDQLAVARELGTRGVMVFSYDWAVSADGGGGEAFLDRVGRALAR